MASVFKPKGSAKYAIVWYDENGRRRKKAGTTDTTVSERIGRDLENRVALVRDGLVDPKAEAFRDHSSRSLWEHLDDYRRNLVAKDFTARHADESTDRVRRLVAVMFGAMPDDVDGKTMTRVQMISCNPGCNQTGSAASSRIDDPISGTSKLGGSGAPDVVPA